MKYRRITYQERYVAQTMAFYNIHAGDCCAVIDTETNGLFKGNKHPPHLVQLAYSIFRVGEKAPIARKSFIVKAVDFDPNPGGNLKHGIDKNRALKEGVDSKVILDQFRIDIRDNDVRFIVGHNIKFDANVLDAESIRRDIGLSLVLCLPRFCTMMNSKQFFWDDVERAKNDKKLDRLSSTIKIEQLGELTLGAVKYPSLFELHQFFFGNTDFEWHNAMADVDACARCFNFMYEKKRKEISEYHAAEKKKNGFWNVFLGRNK